MTKCVVCVAILTVKEPLNHPKETSNLCIAYLKAFLQPFMSQWMHLYPPWTWYPWMHAQMPIWLIQPWQTGQWGWMHVWQSRSREQCHSGWICSLYQGLSLKQILFKYWNSRCCKATESLFIYLITLFINKWFCARDELLLYRDLNMFLCKYEQSLVS